MLVEAALEYAGRGWRVFPVFEPRGGICSCAKGKDCQSPGKHPHNTHGIKDATTDLPRIRKWFEQWPRANVGIATGNGLAVLDVDPRNGGRDSLAALFAEHEYIPDGPSVETGGDGTHLYFATNGPHPSWIVDDGLEIKAAGGAVVAPPSLHVSGRRYRWARSFDLASLPELPAWLLPTPKQQLTVSAGDGTSIPEGRRHRELVRLAGAMRRRGASEDGIFTALKTENANRCTPPLLESELRSIATSVVRYPPERTHDERALPLPAWPSPAESEAFYGLAGDFVRAVEPASEADPVALLVHFLVYVGNVIGSRPHFRVEADKHSTNLFAVIVGGTAKGRKGTARSRVESMLVGVAPEWSRSRIQSGLSSGEGLIWAVRDGIERREPVREKGSLVRYESVEADPGVDDKRLLVIETEFASTLRVMERVGSTLSAIIRDAWDSGNLSAMTKNSPARATGAHVSFIGHITRSELLRYLTTTEAGNGFANRILWCCARRSKTLPEGGEVNECTLRPIMERLRKAIDFARGQDELRRDDETRAIWREVYAELSEGKPGLLGAIISRAEAQVVRLSLLYALLDMSPVIRAEHMRAALAISKYAEASARFIFGDRLGDPVADELLKALRAAPDGLTRSEMSDLFGRNRRAQEIDCALASLAEHGIVDRVEVETERGRPPALWTIAGRNTKETKKRNK